MVNIDHQAVKKDLEEAEVNLLLDLVEEKEEAVQEEVQKIPHLQEETLIVEEMEINPLQIEEEIVQPQEENLLEEETVQPQEETLMEEKIRIHHPEKVVEKIHLPINQIKKQIDLVVIEREVLQDQKIQKEKVLEKMDHKNKVEERVEAKAKIKKVNQEDHSNM